MEHLNNAELSIQWFKAASNIPAICIHSDELYDALTTVNDQETPLELHVTNYEFSYVGLRTFGNTGMCSYGVYGSVHGSLQTEFRFPRQGVLNGNVLELLSWGASRPGYVNKYLPASKHVVDVGVYRRSNAYAGLARALTPAGLQVVARRLLRENGIHLVIAECATTKTGDGLSTKNGAHIVPSLLDDQLMFPESCYSRKADDILKSGISLVGSVCNVTAEQLAKSLSCS